MAAGDTYKLSLEGTCAGQKIVNTMHLRAEAAGDLSQHICDQWNTSLKTSWLACHASNYTLTKITGVQINPPGPVGYERAPASPVVGTNVNTSGSLTTAACVKLTSGYIGRTRRGRQFVGPFGYDLVTAGVLVSGLVTVLNTYYTALLALWGVAGSDLANNRLVVWSVKIADTISQATPPAMGSTNSASAYVLAYSIDGNARSQRRREIGVGA